MITLMVAVVMVASVTAQYNNRNGNDNGYGKGRDVVVNNDRGNRGNDNFNDRFSYNTRERDMKIAKINREYDERIREVRSRFFMNRFKKEQIICKLEDQRKDEIKRVYAYYSYNSNARHDDHGNDRDNHGNGKHW